MRALHDCSIDDIRTKAGAEHVDIDRAETVWTFLSGVTVSSRAISGRAASLTSDVID